MVPIRLIFSVFILCFVGIAIFVQVRASALSLPLPLSVTILSILLPVFAAFNTETGDKSAPFGSSRLRLPAPPGYGTTNGHSSPYGPPGRGGGGSGGDGGGGGGFLGPRAPLLAGVMQAIQAILTTALATHLAVLGLLPSDGSAGGLGSCALQTRWQAMWTAHDGQRIKAVQDALNCCGFNSLKDRAWPFPPGGPPEKGAGAPTCVDSFKRTVACAGPWRNALTGLAALEMIVVLGVGALQIINVVLPRLRSAAVGRSRRGGWMDGIMGRSSPSPSAAVRPEPSQRALLSGRAEGEGDDGDSDVEAVIRGGPDNSGSPSRSNYRTI